MFGKCWADGGRGLVGWVFIVSNLHFVSELVQCVCLDIKFNVREVQNVVIVIVGYPKSRNSGNRKPRPGILRPGMTVYICIGLSF